MLSTRIQLYFPKLRFKKEASFGSWSDGKSSPVFRLDWTFKEEQCRKKHERWLKNHHPDKNIPFINSLPEEYETWLSELLFAVPKHYLTEIRRCAKRALREWEMERNFDTSVREMCLRIAQTYIEVAFRLLVDCTYDEKQNCFYKGDDKPIIVSAALYKFWAHQTGRGGLLRNAKVHELKDSIQFWSEQGTDKASIPIVNKFIGDLEDHNKNFNSAYDILYR